MMWPEGVGVFCVFNLYLMALEISLVLQGRGRVGTGHNFATKKQDYEDEESNKTGKGWHKHAADMGR